MLRKVKATPAQLGEIVVVDSAVFNAHREKQKVWPIGVGGSVVGGLCARFLPAPGDPPALLSLSNISSTIIFALSFR